MGDIYRDLTQHCSLAVFPAADPSGQVVPGLFRCSSQPRFLVRLHTAPVKDVGAAAVCRYNLSTAKAPTEVESLTHSPISTVTVY